MSSPLEQDFLNYSKRASFKRSSSLKSPEKKVLDEGENQGTEKGTNSSNYKDSSSSNPHHSNSKESKSGSIKNSSGERVPSEYRIGKETLIPANNYSNIILENDSSADNIIPQTKHVADDEMLYLTPSTVEGKLKSYGPYIRIYERNTAFQPKSHTIARSHRSPLPKEKASISPSKKYQDEQDDNGAVIDVTSVASTSKRFTRSNQLSAITLPASIKKVAVAPASTRDNGYSLRPSNAGSNILSLSRPTSSYKSQKYARSNGSSSSPYFQMDGSISPSVATSPIARSEVPLDPACPLLPFLQVTNALQLYLKLNVLDNSEKILNWSTGSFLVQSFPFASSSSLKQNTDGIFSLISLFNSRRKNQQELKESSHLQASPPLFYPAYLLLTNKHVYIARPLFRLSKLKYPFQDEQTSYMNPSKLFQFFHKLSLQDLSRIDVGPGRQYLVFHNADKKQDAASDITSIVFSTRSRLVTTLIVDAITTVQHDSMGDVTSHQSTILNQDIEWCIKAIQDLILLRPGFKSTRLVSYYNVWPSEFGPNDIELGRDEFDTGIHDVVTKVDFDFVKAYLFGVFLRYVKPIAESDARGVEIQHTTTLMTREYFYLLEERLDVWPPAIFPPEVELGFSSDLHRPEFQNPLREFGRSKGLLSDKIPQFNLIGVGRVCDVTRVERWRTWRLDSSLDHDGMKGLGRALQNGHMGYLNQSVSHLKQQASTTGFLWWVRIYFGYKQDYSVPEPTCPPTIKPVIGYWWDVAFSYRESCDDLIQAILQARGGSDDIQVVLGDD